MERRPSRPSTANEVRPKTSYCIYFCTHLKKVMPTTSFSVPAYQIPGGTSAMPGVDDPGTATPPSVSSKPSSGGPTLPSPGATGAPLGGATPAPKLPANGPFTIRFGLSFPKGLPVTLTPDPKGSWSCAPGRTCGVVGNGTPAPAGFYPLPNAPQWCLLVRTHGPDSEWQILTKPLTITGPFSDLYFIPNDDDRDDNSGKIQVTATW
jgi:hypothetical protein